MTDSGASPGSVAISDAEVFAIERPHSKLMTYYILCCLASGPLFPILLLPNWFRYHTLRYRFDAQGVSMRWGILFRREVLLNYSRIQDIHLVSNFVERWLGLARIQIQTASGSSSPEMTVEGLLQFEAVRDFLYARMRGHASSSASAAAGAVSLARSTPPPLAGAESGERRQGVAEDATAAAVVQALREATQELKAVREALEKRGKDL